MAVLLVVRSVSTTVVSEILSISRTAMAERGCGMEGRVRRLCPSKRFSYGIVGLLCSHVGSEEGWIRL